MQSHPDLNSLLTNQRTAELRDLADRVRGRDSETRTPLWRRLAGSALIRLGEALVGERRARAGSTLITLSSAQ